MDVWTEPTATHCSHIYCYECIEEGMKTKKECPLCKTPILSKRDLMPMQSLANLIEAFHSLKKKFNQTIELQPSSPKRQVVSDNIPNSTTGNTYEELCSMYPDPTKLAANNIEFKTPKPTQPNRKSNTNNIYGSSSTSTTLTRKRKFTRSKPSSSSEQDGNISDSSTTAIIDASSGSRSKEALSKVDSDLSAKRLKLSQIEDLLSDLSDIYGVFGFSNEKFPFLTTFTSNFQPSELVPPSVSTAISQQTNSQTSSSTTGRKRISRSKLKKLCLIGSNLNGDTKKKLDLAAKVLGADVVTEFTHEVTHLITTLDDNRYSRRTIKYCIGVVSGVWIVGVDWIEKVISSNSHIDELEYCALGDSNVKYDSCKVARERLANGDTRLFSGYRFYFMGKFDPKAKNPTKKELTELVEFGGGTVSQTAFKKPQRKSKYDNIVIGDNEITIENAAKVERETGHTVICTKFLLDCVSWMKIVDRDDYSIQNKDDN